MHNKRKGSEKKPALTSLMSGHANEIQLITFFTVGIPFSFLFTQREQKSLKHHQKFILNMDYKYLKEEPFSLYKASHIYFETHSLMIKSLDLL